MVAGLNGTAGQTALAQAAHAVDPWLHFAIAATLCLSTMAQSASQVEWLVPLTMTQAQPELKQIPPFVTV